MIFLWPSSTTLTNASQVQSLYVTAVASFPRTLMGSLEKNFLFCCNNPSCCRSSFKYILCKAFGVHVADTASFDQLILSRS